MNDEEIEALVRGNKCLVHDCPNHENEDRFVGILCSRCHEMLTTGVVSFGQTFINRLNMNAHIFHSGIVKIANLDAATTMLSMAQHIALETLWREVKR